jgi:hypothetical protein
VSSGAATNSWYHCGAVSVGREPQRRGLVPPDQVQDDDELRELGRGKRPDEVRDLFVKCLQLAEQILDGSTEPGPLIIWMLAFDAVPVFGPDVSPTHGLPLHRAMV